jgi:flagellar hook-length control protein FliK
MLTVSMAPPATPPESGAGFEPESGSGDEFARQLANSTGSAGSDGVSADPTAPTSTVAGQNGRPVDGHGRAHGRTTRSATASTDPATTDPATPDDGGSALVAGWLAAAAGLPVVPTSAGTPTATPGLGAAGSAEAGPAGAASLSQPAALELATSALATSALAATSLVAAGSGPVGTGPVGSAPTITLPVSGPDGQPSASGAAAPPDQAGGTDSTTLLGISSGNLNSTDGAPISQVLINEVASGSPAQSPRVGSEDGASQVDTKSVPSRAPGEPPPSGSAAGASSWPLPSTPATTLPAPVLATTTFASAATGQPNGLTDSSATTGPDDSTPSRSRAVDLTSDASATVALASGQPSAAPTVTAAGPSFAGLSALAPAPPAPPPASVPASSLVATPPPFLRPDPPHVQLQAALAPIQGAAPGEHRLTVALHPADLGPVNVVARMEHGALSVTLASTSDGAHDALQASLPQLRHDLERAGFGTVTVAMDSGSGNGGPGSDGYSRPGNQGRAPAGSGSGEPSGSFGPESPRSNRTSRDAALDRWL